MRPRQTPWPTRHELLSKLSYNPETGDFDWIGGQRAGDWAGSLDRHGNRRINIFRKSEMAHHLAWIIVVGTPPTAITHLDGDKSNNRWSNLCESAHGLNVMRY